MTDDGGQRDLDRETADVRSPRSEQVDSSAAADYAQTLAVWSHLVDVRFKLLAMVPALTATGVGLLGSRDDLASWRVTLVAALGFVTVVALTLYDLRNSMLHNFVVHRLRTLEENLPISRSARAFGFFTDDEIEAVAARDRRSPTRTDVTGRWPKLVEPGALGGVFAERPPSATSFLGVRVQHDLALAVAYSASAAAWAGVGSYSAAARLTTWSSGACALLAAATMTVVIVSAVIGFWWHGVQAAYLTHVLTSGTPAERWTEWPSQRRRRRADRAAYARVVAADEVTDTVGAVRDALPGRTSRTGSRRDP